MTSPSGLDYNTCTTNELRKFITNRRLQPRGPPLSRAACIRRLQREESSPKQTFPFTDLPKELRVEIYRYLLIISPWEERGRKDLKRGAEVGILRTCKFISNEAQDILYGENAARVHMVCVNSPYGVKVYVYRLQNRIVDILLSRKLAHVRSTWPHQLLKFKRIEIKVIFELPTSVGNREGAVMAARKVSLNHNFYSLICFLATSKRLKTMDLKIDEDSRMLLSSMLCVILWPFSRLFRELDLRINGVKIDKKHRLGSIRPQAQERASMDVLATARDMLRKVQIVEELIEISQAFDEREVANIALCAHGLRSVFAMEQHVNRTKEQMVQLSIERAKRCLSDNFIRGVRAAAVRRVEELLDSVELDVDEEEADEDGARGE